MYILQILLFSSASLLFMPFIFINKAMLLKVSKKDFSGTLK
ncbi:hypothetical protein PMAG_a1362 [Pseudoalteromonas mariniglutinosa NCIMB 1770]|nr:hypothetical protein [Pseudoalteromonas mariniglutinosa NCIMB 1770]